TPPRSSAWACSRRRPAPRKTRRAASGAPWSWIPRRTGPATTWARCWRSRAGATRRGRSTAGWPKGRRRRPRCARRRAGGWAPSEAEQEKRGGAPSVRRPARSPNPRGLANLEAEAKARLGLPLAVLHDGRGMAEGRRGEAGDVVVTVEVRVVGDVEDLEEGLDGPVLAHLEDLREPHVPAQEGHSALATRAGHDLGPGAEH